MLYLYIFSVFCVSKFEFSHQKVELYTKYFKIQVTYYFNFISHFHFAITVVALC